MDQNGRVAIDFGDYLIEIMAISWCKISIIALSSPSSINSLPCSHLTKSFSRLEVTDHAFWYLSLVQ